MSGPHWCMVPEFEGHIDAIESSGTTLIMGQYFRGIDDFKKMSCNCSKLLIKLCFSKNLVITLELFLKILERTSCRSNRITYKES